MCSVVGSLNLPQLGLPRFLDESPNRSATEPGFTGESRKSKISSAEIIPVAPKSCQRFDLMDLEM